MRSKYIEKNQLSKFRAYMGDKWYIFELMLQTGMRVGDAVRVRGTNFYKRDGRYYVKWTAQKTRKQTEAEISASLYSHISPRRSAAFCFPGRSAGKHLTRQAVWARIKSASAALAVASDGVSPHSMRKDFAVELMRREGLNAVQKALQHSNSAVTRVYAYADTIMNADSDEPIRWRDIELIVDYILQRIAERS